MRLLALGFTALLITVAAEAQLPDPRDVPPDQCPAMGTAKSAAGRALNRLKNRDSAPTDAEIDRTVTLESMLAPGEDEGRFDENAGVEITGWVVTVQQGGHPETANCGSMSLIYTDTHIAVGPSPNARDTETLIVEVTPRWRAKMAAGGVDWRTETLQNTLIGHKVRFRGWLMFDLDHVSEAENTSPGNPANWRKTVWEIHPITGIQVVQ
jgi:hypothetical protein